MKTVGIIAEYNPFHTGHKYHIEKSREITGADCVVVIMSGNFVQRGSASIADKFTRSKAALLGGADLVIELPTLYSTGSAEIFASGAVSILNRLTGIDYISFGAEIDNLTLLDQIANVLCSEPHEYSNILKEHLKKGLTLPLARKEALCTFLGNYELENVLNTPNNILAIEYLKALKHFNSNISPVIIKRTGSDFHSTSLDNQYASATALRECFNAEDFPLLKGFMPSDIYELYQSVHCSFMPILPEDIDTLLYYSLITKKNNLDEYLDVNNNLANKITNYLKTGEMLSFDELVKYIKSKELTYTRISRALLHIILDIKSSDFLNIKENDYPAYARILGFNKIGQSFLNSIRKTATLPIITNLSDANDGLNDLQNYLVNKDIFAGNIYRGIVKNKFGTTLKDEYRTKPIII